EASGTRQGAEDEGGEQAAGHRHGLGRVGDGTLTIPQAEEGCHKASGGGEWSARSASGDLHGSVAFVSARWVSTRSRSERTTLTDPHPRGERPGQVLRRQYLGRRPLAGDR